MLDLLRHLLTNDHGELTLILAAFGSLPGLRLWWRTKGGTGCPECDHGHADAPSLTKPSTTERG